MIPIAIIASQSRGIKTDDQAGSTEPDFGNQKLKPKALLARCAAFAQVIINHLDAIARPAQTDGAFHEAILKVSAFTVAQNLAHRGLANIDVGLLSSMSRGCFRDSERVGHHWGIFPFQYSEPMFEGA